MPRTDTRRAQLGWLKAVKEMAGVLSVFVLSAQLQKGQLWIDQGAEEFERRRQRTRSRRSPTQKRVILGCNWYRRPKLP